MGRALTAEELAILYTVEFADSLGDAPTLDYISAAWSLQHAEVILALSDLAVAGLVDIDHIEPRHEVIYRVTPRGKERLNEPR